MKCPECESENIYEQGTIIYRAKVTKWDGSKGIEWDGLTEVLWDTSEAETLWCEDCGKEFPEG